jgi:hypothetical protein
VHRKAVDREPTTGAKESFATGEAVPAIIGVDIVLCDVELFVVFSEKFF